MAPVSAVRLPRRGAWIAIAAAVTVAAATAAGCTPKVRDNPDNCQTDRECPSSRCNIQSRSCDPVLTDAGAGGMTGGGGRPGTGGVGTGGGTGGDRSGGATGAGGSDGGVQDGGSGGAAMDAPNIGCATSPECAGSATPVCDVARRICVGCLTGDDCHGGTPACDPASKTCVPCVASTDCSPPTPICETATHACVGCLVRDDCRGNTPACDPIGKTCVPCVGSGDCMSPTPTCDTGTHACVGCLTRDDCRGNGNAPACDTTTKTCVRCVGPGDCMSPTPMCEAATHLCVGCLGPGDCRAPTPVCNTVTKACVGCLGPRDCSDPTPVCDLGARMCVGCLTANDCGAPTPACDTTAKVCVGCLGPGDCDMPTPACDLASKACVGCLGPGDCDMPTPACDTAAKTCVQCLGNGDCAAPLGVCDVPARTCVACLTNPDCGGGTKPLCDGRSCRACKLDAECATAFGADPGLCMPDGHCADASEVVYAMQPNAGTCGAADGTLAKPYCTSQAALDAAIAGPKRIVVLKGDFGGIAATSTPTRITVVGKTATINPIAGIGVDASGTADLFVRDVTITGGTSIVGAGAHVTGATAVLTLQNVRITGNAGFGVIAEGGGLLVMNRCVVKGSGLGAPAAVRTTAAAFRITNSVLADSNSGATLDAAPGGRDQLFKNNTLVGNSFGLACAGSFASGLIFSGNTTDLSPGCTPPICCASNPPLSADYHLPSGSACIDQLTFDPAVPDDIDGQVRPNGPKSDCGADER